MAAPPPATTTAAPPPATTTAAPPPTTTAAAAAPPPTTTTTAAAPPPATMTTAAAPPPATMTTAAAPPPTTMTTAAAPPPTETTELPGWFLHSVFLLSSADELLRWCAVSRDWMAVITSPLLFLERRRLRLPVEPLLVYHLDLLFGSPTGAIARYFPVQAGDAAPPQAAQPVAMVAASSTSFEQLNKDATFTILLLCRAEDLLLWRQVCRVWRDIISSSIFMVAHRDHHAPTTMFLVSPNPFRQLAASIANRANPSATVSAPIGDTIYLESLADSRPNPSAEPLLLIEGQDRLLRLHACLDSVLLLSYNGHLIAVNPVTRRGVLLPPIHTGASVLALFHGANHQDNSPDYRILYCSNERPVGEYRSFSIATRQSLRIGRPAPSRAVEITLHESMPDDLGSPPLVIADTVHWLAGRTILGFDTILSQFGLISLPPINRERPIQLLDMQGVLAVTTIGYHEPTVDVWVQRPEWHRLYHIGLPVNAIVVNNYNPFDFYDYYVVSDHGDVLVDNWVDTGSILHFDSNGVLLGRYRHRDYDLTVVPFTLKKSLLPLC